MLRQHKYTYLLIIGPMTPTFRNRSPSPVSRVQRRKERNL